ncbi:Receptor-like protein 32 [Cardamine amara subsp. amara]|uniref:Receptor-like protein 32 n=1 Tax=Cardamine amara subsp. amara TaxID=228776 RepID=A0ABD1BZ68_CARAN
MNSFWNSISLIFITLSFFFFLNLNFRDVFASPTRHLCHPEQRDAILQFMNELEIQKLCSLELRISGFYGFPKTESWANNSDCCSWDGIICDAKFGDVIELNLSLSCLHGQLNSKSAIFRLHNLRVLHLSSNHFSGEIPSSLGNLSYLTTLDLSINHFSGEIPSSLGNLSYLSTLEVGGNNFNGEIPSSLGRLNQLASLSAGGNMFSGNFPLIILNLTNLSNLYISYNQFAGMLPPNISISLPNLEYFFASHNAFTGTFPSSLIPIPSITYIRLADNQLNGTLEFGNISSSSKLKHLSLGNNNFRGPIPKSISKLVNLDTLDLSNFNTQGSVDFSIFSHLKLLQYLYLSHLNTTTMFDLNGILSCFKSLYKLDLSGNHVSATNKNSVSDPPLLRYFNLSACGLTEFPEILRSQHRMNSLDISNNKIKGEVPSWLWTLPNLEYVNLSNNTFTGFKGPTKPGLSPVGRKPMKYLFGANNNFTGNIPSFLCALGSLNILDLSNNQFDGSISRCVGNFSSTLYVLNLRKNRLTGGLPENISESLISFDVGHNQLEGKLPRSLVRISFLEVLNVESNIINDTFPFWLSSLQELQVLVLRSNAFHGPIQKTGFSKLRIIDISSNHFYGTLPSDCFANWAAISLEKKEDQFNGEYMGTGYYSVSMVLMNKGVALELVRILKIYTAIDFSGNKFEGEIPRSIGILKELHVLNFSNNAFTGHIPSSMANLGELESLDVSQNKLSGEIPQELGNLSYLAYMNFSHNQLVGLLPGGTQFKTQPCSSFKDNLGLYGPSLDEVCGDIHAKTSHQYVTPEQEEDEEEVISWIAAAIGFIPGISFGLMMGYIFVCYKPEWFMNPFGRNKRRIISTSNQ